MNHLALTDYREAWGRRDSSFTEFGVSVAPWVTIYFKESPDATFVVCSPHPDMFQKRVGPDLSVLTGKILEAAGQV